MPRQEGHFRPGIWDQRGQHSETPSQKSKNVEKEVCDTIKRTSKFLLYQCNYKSFLLWLKAKFLFLGKYWLNIEDDIKAHWEKKIWNIFIEPPDIYFKMLYPKAYFSLFPPYFKLFLPVYNVQNISTSMANQRRK
jgi:hypothetical protein